MLMHVLHQPFLVATCDASSFHCTSRMSARCQGQMHPVLDTKICAESHRELTGALSMLKGTKHSLSRDERILCKTWCFFLNHVLPEYAGPLFQRRGLPPPSNNPSPETGVSVRVHGNHTGPTAWLPVKVVLRNREKELQPSDT